MPDEANTPLPAPAAPESRAAVALSCQEVKDQLSRYTSGTLDAALERDMDAHLEGCDACARELIAYRQEDELLTEALADLKPTESFRARVSLMAEIQRQAEQMAESIPQRGWTIFRWIFALLAVGCFLYVSLVVKPPPPPPEQFTGAGVVQSEVVALYWVNATIFSLALFLLLGSRLVAKVESWASAKLGGRLDTGPSRLEILTLEALGLCGVVAASVFHFMYH